MKVLVIGYGPGGVAAATAARAFDSKAEITIVTEEEIPAHKKPGATMVLEYGDTSELNIREWNRETLAAKRINLITGASVVGGNLRKNELELKPRKGETQKLQYDRLIIATGGKPSIPSIPGVDLPFVYTIQTAADTMKITNELSSVNSVAVVGAGFSGLEAAERLHKIGKDVHLIIRSRLMRRLLEPPMSDDLLTRISRGIHIHLGEAPSAVLGDSRATGIQLGEKVLPTDAVLILTGVKPNTKLAEKIGFKPGSLGGIPVNKQMETEVKGVYAVGDCAEMSDFLTGKPILMPVGSTAARAGRQAGVSAVGGTKVYKDTFLRLQYDRIFGTDIVCIGHSSVTASAHGMSTEVEYLEDQFESMKVALVTSLDGRLIGGQVIASRMGARVGYEIMDRIDQGLSLRDSPLTKGRHDRLLELLERNLGPIQ
ncbi:MAG: NAD(P)/FAD-dependent oxidoreductase [Promethearchaeota archaeon]